MSYEGYDQYKCKCGNVDTADVYEVKPTKCSECGSRYHKIRSVGCVNEKFVGGWRKVEWVVTGQYVAKELDYE